MANFSTLSSTILSNCVTDRAVQTAALFHVVRDAYREGLRNAASIQTLEAGR